MARARVLSSFLVTLAVLTLVVGLSMRREPAQALSSGGQTTTQVEYHPVATLANGEAATVHVTNLGTDPGAPPENFTVTFTDTKGAVLSQQTCVVASGQTCDASFVCPAGNGKNGKGACVFRATVVGEEMACVTPGMGTGDWTTDLELFNRGGQSKMILGAHGEVLHLPTQPCGPGVDNGGLDSSSLDSGSSGPDSTFPDSGSH